MLSLQGSCMPSFRVRRAQNDKVSVDPFIIFVSVVFSSSFSFFFNAGPIEVHLFSLKYHEVSLKYLNCPFFDP